MLSNSLLTNARSAAGSAVNSARRLSRVDRMRSLLSSTSLLGEAALSGEAACGAAWNGARPGTGASRAPATRTGTSRGVIADRESGVEGKRVGGRVGHGGRLHKKKKQTAEMRQLEQSTQ